MAFDLSTATKDGGAFDLATAAKDGANAASTSKTPFEHLIHAWKSGVFGPVEAGANLISSAVAKPLSDVAGLAAIPANAMGLTNVDPADVKAAVQNSMTYQPRSDAGKATVGTLGQVADATIGSAGRFAGNYYAGAANMLGAPQGVQDAARNGAQELTNQAPGLLGLGGDAPVAKVPNLNEATAATLQATHNLGIRVTPEYAGMKSNNPLSASNIASVSGSETKMQQALSKYNAQGPVPAVIKQEVGIAPDRPLTQAALDEQRANADGVYAAVKKQGYFAPDAQLSADMSRIGERSAAESKQFGTKIDSTVQDIIDRYSPKRVTVDPSTGQSTFTPMNSEAVVNAVTGLRKDARTGFKSDDPRTVTLATAQQNAANALDSFLDRQMVATQNPLAGALGQARTKLAKINSVEDAFNEANGTVDVKSLTKDLDNGVPLSGGLLDLARAYKAFPKVLQDPAKINVGSGSMVDKALQVGGAIHGNIPEMALGVARPLARARVNTAGYQAGMVNPQLGTVGELLSRLRTPNQP
jgi:hypothetical protein